MSSTLLKSFHFFVCLLLCSCPRTSVEMRFATVWSLVFLSCHLLAFAKKNPIKPDDLMMCTTRCNVKKKTRTRTCATVCEPKSASVVTFTDSKYETYKHKVEKLEAKRKKLEKKERIMKLQNSFTRFRGSNADK